jgi:hypothetical protein
MDRAASSKSPARGTAASTLKTERGSQMFFLSVISGRVSYGPGFNGVAWRRASIPDGGSGHAQKRKMSPLFHP